MAMPRTEPDHVHDDDELILSLSPVKLQKLPHLTDYLSQLQTHKNPLEDNPFDHPSDGFYITPSDVILHQIVYDLASAGGSAHPSLAYHRAGPRRQIFFQPSSIKAAIVTCGGLCPGLNTVVRELVLGLWDLYGVRQIFGIKAGYRGFYSMDPIQLNPKLVHNWHKNGGTVLETSRGGFHLQNIVDSIQHRGYNQVYIIGGDGAMRGAVEIFREICRRKLNIAVTGIPKTVDNDVGIIDRSFGFQTAVEIVVRKRQTTKYMKYCQNMKMINETENSQDKRIYVVHPKFRRATSTGKDGEEIPL